MSIETLVSADDHVHEPVDLWSSRVASGVAHDAPRVVSDSDGDWWVCEGKRSASFGPGSQAGQRFEDPEKLSMVDRAENVRKGGYVPDERIKDMDRDGVAAAILYPTVTIALHSTASDSMMTVIDDAYNEWIAEFCASHPRRLQGIGVLNAVDVPTALGQVERCARHGLVGVMIPSYAGSGHRYFDVEFDPLWAALEEARLPIGFHLGVLRPGPSQEMSTSGTVTPAFRISYNHWAQTALADMIFAGVFARFPRLLAGSVEHELGWIPYFLEQMDYLYTQRVKGPEVYKLDAGALPSDHFHRNSFACFQQDDVGIRLRDVIGVENMLWGSDYPHIESTFPKSREILKTSLAACSTGERAKIVRENAVRLYRLDP